jgi:glyoxylase-like metal-dependent hydrolase (beta-lactamase superfamily II)
LKIAYEIGVIESRMFAENCYIAHLNGLQECLVVDPGLDPGEILDYLESKGLTPAAILNTHGHADHIAGNGVLKERFPRAPLIIGGGDAPKLTDPMGNLSGVFGLPFTSPPADKTVSAGDKLSLAGMELEVLETPGHSCGHVVFVWKEPSPWVVFGGDVLFAGSIGRSDFPDGDHNQLVASIRDQLFTLPDDTKVLPGHGPVTTIGEERRTNPYVGEG